MFQLGYNSYWTFSLQGSAAVQDLLTKKDLKLEDLLDEEGLTVEMKTLNQKLFDFLLQPDNFNKLIKYAIELPDLDEFDFDQKKCYKYPLVCAEILASDSQAIVSEFFKNKNENKESKEESSPAEGNPDDEVITDPEPITKKSSDSEGPAEPPCYNYLDYLFSILDCTDINFTSAGYFAKIVNNLLSKRPTQLLVYLYKDKPELLEKMSNQICSKSVSEFLAKILTFESQTITGVDPDFSDEGRKQVLRSVVKKLTPEHDLEYINNAAYLICEVFGKYNTMHNCNEILKELMDKTTIDNFFEIMRQDSTASSCAIALILGNIFAYYILISSTRAQANEEMAANEIQRPIELADIPLVIAMLDNFEHINNYLKGTSSDVRKTKTQFGGEVLPFGSARLKILELVIISMKANNRKIYTKIAEIGLLETLLGLIVKYEWNNMIHNQVEKVLTLILDGTCDELKSNLFENAHLLEFIAQACEEPDFKMINPKERRVRKGYLGQLIRLASKIEESKDPIIMKYVETSEAWKDFLDKEYKDATERNKINFGGRDPRIPIEEPEQDVHLDLPDFMQKFNKFFKVSDASHDKQDDNEEPEDAEDKGDDMNDRYDENNDPFTTKELVMEENSSPVKGRSSFGHIIHKPDDDMTVLDEEKVIDYSQPVRIIEMEQRTDDEERSEYYDNNYFPGKTSYSGSNVDELLKEFDS
jgi:hypothetical protein